MRNMITNLLYVCDAGKPEKESKATKSKHKEFFATEEAHDLGAERVHDGCENDLDRRKLQHKSA